jgi:acyl-CoA dehydrogenase family protein 9
VKKLYIGEYMYEYLKYPEYEHNYQLENLNKKYVEPLKTYITNTSYQDIISKNGNFTVDSMNKFKDLNLFSMSFPKDYNGQELDATGITRLLEICSIYPSLGINLIYNNEIASKCVLYYGNKSQRDKYLPKLSSGELRLGFCYSEPDNGCDMANFNLISNIENKNLPEEQQKFILNGKKSWVTLMATDQMNDETIKSNLGLIVISKTLNTLDDDEDSKKSLNAFLIDANTDGIKINKKISNQNGLNLYEIEFKNVKIGNECLLGTHGSGFEISNKIIENSRYLVGAICISILKDFFKETINYCINNRRFGKSLCEFSIIKERLAYVETSLYTMESMTYMTAGIVDSYEQPDVGIEAALTKIFCTESLMTSINECIKIMSMHGLTSLDELKQKYLNDINYISAMLNTNDLLRLYTATNGMVLAGVEYGDSVRKMRNPFTNPTYFIRQVIANHRLVKATLKKTPEYLYLWEHLHPSLNEHAKFLEQSAVKFMLSVKSTMIGMGREAIEAQMHLKYLSDMSMHIYAMNAAISRASRAYSIGLPNAQHELALALVQANESSIYINKLCKHITDGQTGSGIDNILVNISDKSLKNKDHAASHCLTRNY